MNTGVICEFNPFHAGHKYLFEKIRESGNDKRIICVMSGNFVQRGDFAVYNKFTRAKAALQNGADLVIELPAEQALLSAEGFAKSAVMLAESLGVVDELAFGAENNNIAELKKMAEMLKDKNTQEKIKAEMKARFKAIFWTAPTTFLPVNILRKPNFPALRLNGSGKGMTAMMLLTAPLRSGKRFPQTKRQI